MSFSLSRSAALIRKAPRSIRKKRDKQKRTHYKTKQKQQCGKLFHHRRCKTMKNYVTNVSENLIGPFRRILLLFKAQHCLSNILCIHFYSENIFVYFEQNNVCSFIYGYKICRWLANLTLGRFTCLVLSFLFFFLSFIRSFVCSFVHSFIDCNLGRLSLIFDDECHSLSNAYFTTTYTSHTFALGQIQ